MTDISLITSLYRSDTHLPTYIKYVKAISEILQVHALSLEIVVVVNDATSTETRLLHDLLALETLQVQVLSVPRETLYASWNRGINAASGAILGVWNVDDRRTADGLLNGYALFQADSALQLIDFPFLLRYEDGDTIYQQPQFKPKNYSPKTVAAPFFLFRRTLYEANGPFNEHFRITGDFEWCKRDLVRRARYAFSDVTGGTFVVHGGNLSTGTHPLEWVEINTVLVWHGAYAQMRPVDPDLMRESWQAWGHIGGSVPDHIARWLWGEGARERYEAYIRERNTHPLLRRIRLALARRGLWHSVEWDVHHRSKGFFLRYTDT